MVWVLHDRQAKHLQITIRCGHLQMGYYDLVLDYFGARISDEHDQILAVVARTTRDRNNSHDLRYQELDLSQDGRIEHRLMFRPGVWISIICDELTFQRVPKPDGKLPRFKDRYPGGPPASIISQLLESSS